MHAHTCTLCACTDMCLYSYMDNFTGIWRKGAKLAELLEAF